MTGRCAQARGEVERWTPVYFFLSVLFPAGFWLRIKEAPFCPEEQRPNGAVFTCRVWSSPKSAADKVVSNVNLKPYDGTTNFSLWRAKMKAILIKEKCYRAVTEEWLDPTSAEKKKEISDIAHSEIMIRLSDEGLRQVVNISEP
ncbi:hypothetical protein QQ045_007898 [Rhodiola kirilowii]